MKHIRIIVIAISLIVLNSCEKDLDIKYHNIAPLTVIEGELTPEGIKVGITLTTPMNEPMDRTLLTDASVSLLDLTEEKNYMLYPDSLGYFVNPLQGIIGHNYRLTVTRNGKIYEAETTMYPPTEIVNLEFNWIKMPYDYVAVLQGQFLDVSENKDYSWIKIYRNGEIYQWGEMSDKGDVDGVLTFITMTSRKDTDEEDDESVLYDGDVITVIISTISHAMYDYLEALQNDSSGPAMFTGDKCLGYFMATSPVSKSIVFHPDEIPVYK